ncbi:hypothetical protein ACFC26_00735 [Kitasatospora purpeofusca]|uniref:hypothetical protein n=1 Tax=Kitasatospora purpeofusca TaxID=67352 RepID=UPI0035E2E8BE
MSVFDQRNQQVGTQYNIAGSATFGGRIETRDGLVDALRTFVKDVRRAEDEGSLDVEVSEEVQAELVAATRAARNEESTGDAVGVPLSRCRQILEAAAGPATLLSSLAGIVAAVPAIF